MAEFLALITEDTIDEALLESFVSSSRNGAIVIFKGIVRNHDHGDTVTALEYEAHPDAVSFLENCARQVASEFDLAVAASHRIGSLVVGDVALFAAVASPHRAQAFAASSKLVELIKSTVPIWKRQHLADGVTEWVGL
jgi:molybdopterin synthase catalytic subunit